MENMEGVQATGSVHQLKRGTRIAYQEQSASHLRNYCLLLVKKAVKCRMLINQESLARSFMVLVAAKLADRRKIERNVRNKAQ